jgi:hypothetical protein
MPLQQTKKVAGGKRRRKNKQDVSGDNPDVSVDALVGNSVDGGYDGDEAAGDFLNLSGTKEVRDVQNPDNTCELVSMEGLAHFAQCPAAGMWGEREQETLPYEAGFEWMWNANASGSDADEHRYSVSAPSLKVYDAPLGGLNRGANARQRASSDIGRRKKADGQYSGQDIDGAEVPTKNAESDGERSELEQDTQCPTGRINCAMLVCNHTLVIYGGVREHKNREFALDDCWSIDLNKRDTWQCLMQGSMHAEDDTSEASSDDRDTDDDDDDDDGSESDRDEGLIGAIPEEEYEGEATPLPGQHGEKKRRGGTSSKKRTSGAASDSRAPVGTKALEGPAAASER